MKEFLRGPRSKMAAAFLAGGLAIVSCGTPSNPQVPEAVQKRGGTEWANTLHYIFAQPKYFQDIGACASQLAVEAAEIEPHDGGAGMGFDYLSAGFTALADKVSCRPSVPSITLEVDGKQVIVTHADIFPTESQIPHVLNH